MSESISPWPPAGAPAGSERGVLASWLTGYRLRTEDFDVFAERYPATPEHACIKRELSSKLPTNLQQDSYVLSLSIRIEGRHDASLSKIDQFDQDFADAQLTSRP